MNSKWINNFDDFWQKRRAIAKILRNTSPETEFQWNWVASRNDGNVCIEQCNDPHSNRPLTFKQGIHLIAEALEIYRESDWHFKEKGDYPSAAFEVYLLDLRSRAQRIYVKIAVLENANLMNPLSRQPYRGTRIKLWSFHPPEK